MKKTPFQIIKKKNSLVRLLKPILFLNLLFLFVSTAGAGELFVSSSTGANSNEGSKAKPFKNIEKALNLAKKGDIIRVAEGNYFGLRGKGYLEVPEPVQIIGHVRQKDNGDGKGVFSRKRN